MQKARRAPGFYFGPLPASPGGSALGGPRETAYASANSRPRVSRTPCWVSGLVR
jgi:hypothetical protein